MSCIFHWGAGSMLKNALQLEKQTASLSLLLDSKGDRQVVGGLPLFLEDEGGQLVSALQGWLDTLDRQMGATGESMLPPLLISGLTKVGSHWSCAQYIAGYMRSHLPLVGVAACTLVRAACLCACA